MSEELQGSGFESGSADSGSADSGSGVGSTSGGANPGTSTEQLFEIKWGGKTQKVPLSQAIEFAQKGYDYTQKMQALAKEREEFGSTRQRYDQAFAEVRSFLQDKQKVRDYLRRLEGSANDATLTAQESGQMGDMVTAELLQKKLQEAKQEFAGFASSQIQELRAQISTEQLAGKFAQELDSHIAGLKKAMPELRAIPQIERFLKDEVRAMGPANIQEAKDMMIEVAKQQQKDIKQFILEQTKTGGVAGASGGGNPLRNGIEPAGGAPPLPVQNQERSYKGGISNPDFKRAIIAEMEELARKG